MKKKSVCEKINISDILEDGLVVSYDLKYSYCYELAGIDMEMKSSVEQANQVAQINGFLNNVEEGLTLQIVNRVEYGRSPLIDTFKKNQIQHDDEKLKFFSDDNIEHIKTFPQRQHKLYLYVTYDNRYKKAPLYLLPRLFSNNDSQEIRLNRKKSLEVLSLFENSTLPLFGLKARRLNGDETFRLMFNYLNNNKACHLSPERQKTEVDNAPPSLYQSLPYLKNKTVRDQLVRSPFQNSNPGHIVIDDLYYMTINMEMLPQGVGIQTILSMIKPKFPFEFSIQITSPNEKVFVSQLEAIRKLLRISSLLKTKKHEKDVVSSIQKDEIDATKTALELAHDKAFEVRLMFIVHHHDLKGCRNKARIIENMCQSLGGMQVNKDDYCHLNNFMSLLPGAYQLNERKAGMLGRDLAQMVPISQSWQGTKDVQFIIQNKDRELLPLSYKTEQEDMAVPNTLVVGQPGEGKSWFTNYLIKSLLVHNPKTFISVIDNGGSYKKLATIFKDTSTYIEMDYSADCAFNYFSEKRIVMENEATYGRYKTYIGNLLYLTIQNEGDPDYSESQKYLIETGINALYDSISDTDIPLLEDFQDIARKITPRDEEDEQFRDQLVKNLDGYTDPKSSKSIIFNRRSSIKLDSPKLFVDIQNIDQDPKFQAIYNSMINKQMRDRMIYFPEWRQVIIFDEVWKAWKSSKSKEFQEEAARKGRKNDTSIVLLSQFVKDFADESIASIRNACPIHYIFKTTDLPLLKKAPFNYNDNKLRAIENMKGVKGKSSQFFIKWGDRSSIAHIEGSKIDGVTCSTDAITRLQYKDIYDNKDADMFDIIKKIKAETA